MPSLLENTNLSQDYHVFTNDNYWLQQLGLGSFTTGTLYDFWYEVDPQTGDHDLNRKFFKEKEDSFFTPEKTFFNDEDDEGFVTEGVASFDAWRFIEAGRGKYEYIEDILDWQFNDFNKQALNHYSLPFSYSDLGIEEFRNKDYIPPSTLDDSDNGEFVSILNPTRFREALGGDAGDNIGGLGDYSAIVCMNKYMRYYSFKNPDRTTWDTKHLARLEFLDDIKTSRSGCLNISATISIDVSPGRLDSDGLPCIKDVETTHNLFLYDENQEVKSEKTAIMAVTKHAGVPKDTTGRVYSNRQDGDMTQVNPDDPTEEVVGDIDLHYNEYTKTWQSGSRQILAKLTTSIPKAQWLKDVDDIAEINITESLETPDGESFYVLGSGEAMPIVMQNGNPFQWTPNYATTKDCREKEDKTKATVQVFNPDTSRTFSKNQTVLLNEIDGLWMPLEFGSGAADAPYAIPSIFLGRWDFTYLAIPQPFFFYRFSPTQDVPIAQGDLSVPKYIVNEYARFTPIQAEKAFHKEYYNSTTGDDFDLNTAGDLDPVKYALNNDAFALPKWYHQFHSFDFMDEMVGGTRGKKRSLNSTVYGQTSIGSPVEDQVAPYNNLYFGCLFPEGYRSERVEQYNSERDFDLVPHQDSSAWGTFMTGVAYNDGNIFVDGGVETDQMYYRTAYAEGAADDLNQDGQEDTQPTPMFAGVSQGDFSVAHFPADIATHCSPSGNYGRPIFDAGYLHLLHRPNYDTLGFNVTDDYGGNGCAYNMRKFFFSDGINLDSEQKSHPYGHGHRSWMYKAPSERLADETDEQFEARRKQAIYDSAYDMQPVKQNKVQFRPLKTEVYANLGCTNDFNPSQDLLSAGETSRKSKLVLYDIVTTKCYDALPAMSAASSARHTSDWNMRSAKFTQTYHGGAIPGLGFNMLEYTQRDRRGRGRSGPPLQFDFPEDLSWNVGNRSDRVLGFMFQYSSEDEPFIPATRSPAVLGHGVAGVIGAVCTVSANEQIQFNTENRLGLPSFFRGGLTAASFVPQWGGSSKSYNSWNTTDLHVRIYQAHPREHLIYDPRTFAVHHFNDGVNLPIERDATSTINSNINGIAKTFADYQANVEFVDVDGDGNPDCWVDKPGSSVDIRVPSYVSIAELNATALRWQDEDLTKHPNLSGSDTNTTTKAIPNGKVVMSDGVQLETDNWGRVVPIEFWNVDPRRRGKLLPFNYRTNTLGLADRIENVNQDGVGIFGEIYISDSGMQNASPNGDFLKRLPADGIEAHKVDAVVTNFGAGYEVGDTLTIRGAEGSVVTVNSTGVDGSVNGFVVSPPTESINPDFLLPSGAIIKKSTTGSASLSPIVAFGKGFNMYFPRAIMGQGVVRTDSKPKIATDEDAIQLSLVADNSSARAGATGGVEGGVLGFGMSFFFGTNQWGTAGGGAIEVQEGNRQVDALILPQNAAVSGLYDCFFHFHNDLSHTWMYDDYAYTCRITDNFINLTVNPI